MSDEEQAYHPSESRPRLTSRGLSSSLYPTIIKDASAEGAGIVASQIAAEDEGLISDQTLQSHSYGSISKGPDTTENVAEDSDYALPKAKLFTVISSLFMASFLAALDTTVVTTLLSVIASELNAVANISWIATAYLLSCSAFQPLFGKLSDIFGRKILLLLCTAFFAIGCAICATDSLGMLVFGRFVTGLGGSGLTTLGTITMSDLIPLRERGLYQGLANVFYGLGTACGGIMGGYVADSLGWKYVFTLQVPLAILVGLALWMFLELPEGSPGLGAKGSEFKDKLKRVDFQGSFLLVAALICVLLAASMGGREIAYSSKSFLGLVLISVILLGGFIYTEAYISAEPIIPIELLTERTILASSLTNWFYTMAVFTYMYYIPLYFTSVMDLTATESGKRYIPNFFAVSLGSVGAGVYMKRTGRYYKLSAVMGIVSILGVWRIYNITPEISVFTQYTLVLPSGFGYACMLTITLLSLIAAVPVEYQACTTSIQYTFRSTGSTLGVSIASAIFQNILKQKLTTKIHALIPDDYNYAESIIKKALENTSYSSHAPKLVQGAINASYELGCKGAFAFSLATVILGYISSLFIKEHALHTSMNRD